MWDTVFLFGRMGISMTKYTKEEKLRRLKKRLHELRSDTNGEKRAHLISVLFANSIYGKWGHSAPNAIDTEGVEVSELQLEAKKP